MNNLRIFVAGHNGMVGSALTRLLNKKKNNKIITIRKKNLDLTDQQKVQKFFLNKRIDQVYLAAAKVGGIYANNTFPADFIYENIMIQTNVINAAFNNGIKKLLFLGSSCIYPRNNLKTMNEQKLLTGTLEPTNEPYAIAKIAGIKLCESYNRQYGKSHGIDYRSVMPTNLYGPGDNYHPDNSHVIPGLMRRFHEAKIKNAPSVRVWGTGKPRREFLYVDDMASACIHVMNLNNKIYNKFTSLMCSHINVGSNFDITINELAKMIKSVVGFKGKIKFDKTKPDGNIRKLIDSKLINKLGWKPKVSLEDGLSRAYKDYIMNKL
jgi:GDP-L-fucose synthase